MPEEPAKKQDYTKEQNQLCHNEELITSVLWSHNPIYNLI